MPAFSLFSRLDFSELFLFLREQIKQGLPLALILLLGQALSKMLDIQVSDPLIHSSHKQPQRLPCLSVYKHSTARLQVSRQNSGVAAVRYLPNCQRLIAPACVSSTKGMLQMENASSNARPQLCRAYGGWRSLMQVNAANVTV